MTMAVIGWIILLGIVTIATGGIGLVVVLGALIVVGLARIAVK